MIDRTINFNRPDPRSEGPPPRPEVDATIVYLERGCIPLRSLTTHTQELGSNRMQKLYSKSLQTLMAEYLLTESLQRPSAVELVLRTKKALGIAQQQARIFYELQGRPVREAPSFEKQQIRLDLSEPPAARAINYEQWEDEFRQLEPTLPSTPLRNATRTFSSWVSSVSTTISSSIIAPIQSYRPKPPGLFSVAAASGEMKKLGPMPQSSAVQDEWSRSDASRFETEEGEIDS